MKISIDDYVAQTAETNPDIDSDRLRLLLENSQESLVWLNGLVEQIGGCAEQHGRGAPEPLGAQ